MKKIVNSDEAPAPLGPYNHSVQAGPFLFVSGQIAIDPTDGSLVTHEIQAETHQALKNVKAILKASGLSFQDVVKTSIFVKDMNDYGKINEVYSQYFEDDTAPARELVQVAALPKFVNIEISVIAFKE